jgi:hypothetical protein
LHCNIQSLILCLASPGPQTRNLREAPGSVDSPPVNLRDPCPETYLQSYLAVTPSEWLGAAPFWRSLLHTWPDSLRKSNSCSRFVNCVVLPIPLPNGKLASNPKGWPQVATEQESLTAAILHLETTRKNLINELAKEGGSEKAKQGTKAVLATVDAELSRLSNESGSSARSRP